MIQKGVRRIFRRTIRRKQDVHWTSQLEDSIVINNNATTTMPLVVLAQFAATAGVERNGPTIVRIRFGTIDYFSTLAARHTVWLAIIRMDTDAVGVFRPDLVNNAAEYDVLWWTSRSIAAAAGSNAVIAGDGGGPIDIRAKRTLHRQGIYAVARSTGGAAGATGDMTFACRILMKGDLF